MEIVDRYEKLKVRAIQHKTQVNQHYKSAVGLKQQYKETSQKLEESTKSSIIQESSINVLKEVIDKMSREHIERIVDLLTYALKTIFFDKDYSVEVVINDKRNAKTAEFYLLEETETEKIRSPFDNGIGGGIQAIVGFVLQVFYLGYLNQATVLFCDESFSQVSSQYIDPLIQFINELARSKEFIFVLVSHDTRLIPYAKKTYEVESGKVKEVKSVGSN